MLAGFDKLALKHPLKAPYLRDLQKVLPSDNVFCRLGTPPHIKIRGALADTEQRRKVIYGAHDE